MMQTSIGGEHGAILEKIAKAQELLAVNRFYNAIEVFYDAEKLIRAQDSKLSSMQCFLAFAIVGRMSADLALLSSQGGCVSKLEIDCRKQTFFQQLAEVEQILVDIKAGINSAVDENSASIYNKLLVGRDNISLQGRKCFCMAYLKYAQNDDKLVNGRMIAADHACRSFKLLPANLPADFANFHEEIAGVYSKLSEIIPSITKKIKCIQSALNALESMAACDVHRKNDLILALLGAYKDTNNIEGMRHTISKYAFPNCENFKVMSPCMRLEVFGYCFSVAKDEEDLGKQFEYARGVGYYSGFITGDIAPWMMKLSEECIQTLAKFPQLMGNGVVLNEAPVPAVFKARFFSVPTTSSDEPIARKREAAESHYDANVGSKKMRISELCNDGSETSTGSISPQAHF